MTASRWQLRFIDPVTPIATLLLQLAMPPSQAYGRGVFVFSTLCSHQRTRPALANGYRICVTLPVMRPTGTGPYVLLSRLSRALPSPCTQT